MASIKYLRSEGLKVEEKDNDGCTSLRYGINAKEKMIMFILLF